ncbi:type III pantothenate kinase [Thalassotalea sp. PS06]|uniref:type III pantothenate kinase n=1 Tax=Thalassotalea sp. PS06 TaxID=2594005 RepID=UPI00163D83E6|nr:type III pantothenate kinase [Thalassotalea sp. PS06]
MIVLLDVGNTQIKFCQVLDNSLSEPMSLDESQVIEQIQRLSPDKVLVCAVSNEAFCQRLEESCLESGCAYKRLLTPDCLTQIKVGYQQPEQLGIDRWMAVVGAAQVAPRENVLVVDAGTATTIDLLSKENKHLGGWIVPGVDMMINALYQNTDKVKGDFSRPADLGFAGNTSDNVNRGCWAMTVALIEYAVRQAAINNVPVSKILLTGGNGKVLQANLQDDTLLCPELVFIGMRQFIDL